MTDIATRQYWDDQYADAAEVPDFSALLPDVTLRRLIAKHLHPKRDQRLIELGAGNTAYLPQLARAFGYRVAGIDYSERGCELARRNLLHFGVDGEIRYGDLFEPPQDWLAAFDVVFTMGVAEHFDDTAAIVHAFARYARPGGVVLTVIPNMRGLPGALTKFLSLDLYHRHVAMGPAELAAAHHAAGLEVLHAAYLVGVNFWVSNPDAATSSLRRLAAYPLLAFTRLAWAVERRGWVRIKPSRTMSPWVVVIGQA